MKPYTGPENPDRERGTALVPVGAYPVGAPESYPGRAPSGADGGIDLWGAVQILWRRRWLILAVIAAGLGLATVVTLGETPLYRTGATIEVQRQETRIIEGGEVAPVEVADADYLATQFALIRSRALAERVAESLDLPSDPRYAAPGASREQRLDQAAGAVMRGLSVEPVARSRVIMVSFVSPYPREAARIADAIAENFIEANLERKLNATAYARTFLEDRLRVTKETLESSERKLVEYAQKYGILDFGAGSAAEVGDSLEATSLRTLSAALTESQSARIGAEQRYLEARNNPTTLNTLTSPAFAELKGRRSALALELQQKLLIYKPDFPEVIELKARVEAIDQEIEKERSSIVSALRAEYEAAVAREASLRSRVVELSGSLQGERSDRIEYNILRREVDSNRAQHDALMQRLKEVSIASGVATNQVSIVDRAKPPSAPFSPDLRGALIRALMLSFGFAVLLVFALEYLDDTVKAPDDLLAKLGVACLGVLPKVTGRANIMEQMADPKSHLSEAFISARTIIQYSTASGPPKSLLVTGTRAAEGKTSAALGLALSFAAVGLRVLIIDGDMRRPSFATPPGSKSRGLAGLLTSQEPLAAHLVESRSPNLYLLPCGPIPPNPAELLSSPRLRVVIAEAENAFDMVIVDPAPVLAFADAPLLGAACEATLLVAHAGVTRRPAASNAIVRLLVSRANIIGAILSKYDSRRDLYASSYGYGYKAHDQGEDVRKRRRAGADSEGEGRSVRVFADAAPSSPHRSSTT